MSYSIWGVKWIPYSIPFFIIKILRESNIKSFYFISCCIEKPPDPLCVCSNWIRRWAKKDRRRRQKNDQRETSCFAVNHPLHRLLGVLKTTLPKIKMIFWNKPFSRPNVPLKDRKELPKSSVSRVNGHYFLEPLYVCENWTLKSHL